MKTHSNNTVSQTHPSATRQRHGWRLPGMITAILMVGVSVMGGGLPAKSPKYQEYEIKTAFIYNFLKFIDWPDSIPPPSPPEKTTNANPPKKKVFTIGIFGKLPFGCAREKFLGKKLGEYKIEIRLLEEKNYKTPQALRQALRECRVLFLTLEDKVNAKKVLAAVQGNPILTVGEMGGFLEQGGIINFLIENKKVRFEVNLEAAAQAQLTIRSKLLRLAKRIIPRKKSAPDRTGEK